MKNTPAYKFKSLFKMIVKLAWLVSVTVLISCDPEIPEKEDVPELITKVTLTFAPSGGGTAVVATATDPDGMGIRPIEIDGDIGLDANTSYILSVELINELADVSDPLYNVTDEVEEEGDEHLFFFGWTNNVFSDPSGNGN